MLRLLALLSCCVVVAACNCGGPASDCSAANCTGCCDVNGACVGGGEPLACGSAGADCSACSILQQCLLGTCRDVGAGGGSGTGGGAGTSDAGTSDAGTSDAGTFDAGTFDAGTFDAGTFDAGTSDAGTPDAGGARDAGPPDAGPPDAGPMHVHILISNTCVVQVQPASLNAPLNSNLKLDFHNHSVNYQADVWSSRGYGYLQLATGGLWHDPINHCGGPMAYTEYFDISIAGGGSSGCPAVRFNIYCQ